MKYLGNRLSVDQNNAPPSSHEGVPQLCQPRFGINLRCS